MEIFSALLALCAGNSPVPDGFPTQRPVTRSFNVFCVWINGWVNNREAGDLRRYRAHYEVTVMLYVLDEQVLVFILRKYIMHFSLQWRHYERDVVPNNRRHDCLLNRLFWGRPKKISKLRVTDLCEGNPPVSGGFSSGRASSEENVSIWWRRHACLCFLTPTQHVRC